MSYADFLDAKRHHGADDGIDPDGLGESLFPFQRSLVEWALRRGRAAILADCGLGKSLMQLEWARAVARHAGRPVLVATPLAVGAQLVREGEKFGIECVRSRDGIALGQITVTNYERLHLFSPHDFAGMVCDESSILKNFDGARKATITDFMRKLPYRLLCTATAAPNDYTELGTSSEALGHLGHMDMLSRFFKNDQNTSKARVYLNRGALHSEARERSKWRFKGHAEIPFWRWVSSWARAVRRPSDIGFSDDGFDLPPLIEREHIAKGRGAREGFLFDLPAIGMREEREERRRTISERCEMVAGLVNHGRQALAWCHLNPEGDELERRIDGAVQVAGSDSDEDKESRLTAFARGEIRVLVTKPKIGAWGLNLQKCDHITFFPSHSYEQYYQGVRRCWRFGQPNTVTVDVVATEGERGVSDNLRRKAAQADRMFAALVSHMNDSQRIARHDGTLTPEIPSWLSTDS